MFCWLRKKEVEEILNNAIFFYCFAALSFFLLSMASLVRSWALKTIVRRSAEEIRMYLFDLRNKISFGSHLLEHFDDHWHEIVLSSGVVFIPSLSLFFLGFDFHLNLAKRGSFSMTLTANHTFLESPSSQQQASSPI